jgi:predicted HD phosphohydrolase
MNEDRTRMSVLVLKKLDGNITVDEMAELERMRSDIEAPFAQHMAEQERIWDKRLKRQGEQIEAIRGIIARLEAKG